MAILLLISGMAIPILWLGYIRPYCIRNRQGYTPGGNVMATMWVDWQLASEISAENGDTGMRRICRAFLILHLLAAAVLLVSILGKLPS